jgi:hypothetical protein
MPAIGIQLKFRKKLARIAIGVKLCAHLRIPVKHELSDSIFKIGNAQRK